ncbi:MAG: hypothetical protein ACRDPY_16325 [Streptosporangiaceae bacterium]
MTESNQNQTSTAAIVAAVTPYVQAEGPNEMYPPGGYVAQEDRRAYLAAALAGVELGAYDERILTWLIGWDDYTARLIISLIVRARRVSYDEGTEDGPLPGWRLVMQRALRDAIRYCEREAGNWPADQIGLYRALGRELGIEEDL